MRLFLVFILLLISQYSLSAQVLEFNNQFLLEGEIQTGDSDKFLNAILDSKGNKAALYLNSEGGDLEEAIKVGGIVKELGISVYVKKNGVCASACFFIYMNGINKMAAGVEFKEYGKEPPLGYIAIHRPYFRVVESDKIQNQKLIEFKTSEYLSKLSVPQYLIEKMMSVSSADSYFLTNEDIDRLPAIPSEVEELYISKCNYNAKNPRNSLNCTVNIVSEFFVDGYTKIKYGWKPKGYLFSNWKRLAEFSNGTIHIDFSSLEKKSKLAKAWVMIDYKDPLGAIDESDEDTQSSIEFIEFDCKLPKFRAIAGEYYSEKMATGNLIWKLTKSAGADWRQLKDGGEEISLIRKEICN